MLPPPAAALRPLVARFAGRSTGVWEALKECLAKNAERDDGRTCSARAKCEEPRALFGASTEGL